MGPAKRPRGARPTEALEVNLLAASQERFSFPGKHYNSENERLHPRRAQQPIDVWFCGGTSLLGARRAGKAGVRFDRSRTNDEEIRRAIDAKGYKVKHKEKMQ